MNPLSNRILGYVAAEAVVAIDHLQASIQRLAVQAQHSVQMIISFLFCCVGWSLAHTHTDMHSYA